MHRGFIVSETFEVFEVVDASPTSKSTDPLPLEMCASSELYTYICLQPQNTQNILAYNPKLHMQNTCNTLALNT